MRSKNISWLECWIVISCSPAEADQIHFFLFHLCWYEALQVHKSVVKKSESLLSRFKWGGKDLQKKLVPIAWRKLCLTSEQSWLFHLQDLSPNALTYLLKLDKRIYYTTNNDQVDKWSRITTVDNP